MKIFHNPLCLLHDTVELIGSKLQKALESPDRLSAILEALGQSPHELVVCGSDSSSKAALAEYLRKTHDDGYIEHLRTAWSCWSEKGLVEPNGSILPECFPMPATSVGDKVTKAPKDIFARPGFYAFDMSTGIMQNSWTAVEASAELAVSAAKHLLSILEGSANADKVRSAMALCRPPGHHCTTSKAGGFCYVNNAVLAVEVFRNRHVLSGFATPKVAVLDLDFHHGNGTQDVFYEDASVLYVSIHGEDEYPYYSGAADERGAGAGFGYNVNLPLAVNASLQAYNEQVKIAVEAIRHFGAEYMVVSLGFDTYMLDPLGKFQIETGDYETIARLIRGDKELRTIPTVILLEGGYVVEKLGKNLLSFLKGWEDAEKNGQREE